MVAAGLATAACLFNLAGPLLVERLLRGAASPERAIDLWPAFAILLATLGAAGAASIGNAYLLGGVGIEIVRDLRSLLYRRLQQLPLSWYDRTPAGAVISRVMDDAAVVQSVTSGQTMSILVDLGTAGGAVLWLGAHSGRLLVVVLCFVPVYALIFRIFTGRIYAGAFAVRHGLDRVFGHLKQKIDGMLVVKATVAEASEVAAFSRQMGELHRPRLGVSWLGVTFSNLCIGVGGIGATVMFAVGAFEVTAGRLTAGEVVVASGLAGLMFGPIARLSDLATLYQQARASLERLCGILDGDPSADPGGNHTTGLLAPANGLIEFQNVSFAYQSDRPALQDVSLRIEPGMKVAIVGPTGSGKSTLVNLLLRFYEPTSGIILIDGAPLAEVSAPALRSQFSLVPQDPIIFRGTLAENIRYGSPLATQADIEAAARAARVHDFAVTLPHGYDTIVGEGGLALSQGQRQRVAIARVLCHDPAVVVLDEATSSLDRPNEAAVQEAMSNLFAGRTTITIAHRLATVRGADVIVVLDQGKIVQVGTHQALLADREGLYRLLHDAQLPDPRNNTTPHRPQPALQPLAPLAA